MTSRAKADHLLNTAIQPALLKISLWNPASQELLLGTALVESGLLHRRQFGGGPARGLFQMEPHTHDDIWKNYLKYKPQLAKAVTSLLTSDMDDKLSALETNDKYAAAMARAHYLRKPAALPRAGDVEGMAHYWKDNYNTQGGHGKWERYVEVWRKTTGVKS